MARPDDTLLTELQIRQALSWQDEKAACEASLKFFLRAAWPYFDSAVFVAGFHIDAICDHLEAVSRGQIKRLLINIPPRHGKTNIVAVAWPVWTWIAPPDARYPLLGPGVRFLAASYGANKAEADGVTARRLIGTAWFKERWGDRVQILRDRDNQGQYDNSAGGYRISTGIPESLGKGGNVRLLDDAHKVDDVESDIVRNATLRSYDEVWRTRSNDPVQGAEVVIMQRLAENDIAGHILAEEDPDLVHLMLPLEYDGRRHCHTKLPFDDPRTVDGELLWPERFSRAWVDRQRKLLGPHAFQGQYQQIPVARGGGIILREWWMVWPPDGEEASWTKHIEDNGRMRQVMLYPDLEYVLVSCDTAYGEKEESDWSACTTWGVFRTPGDNPAIILLEAWRERLPLKPLVEKILNTARKRQADAVLVEARASGLSVLQEIRRLARDGEFTLFADMPRGDKVARLHAVSAAFSGGLIYAPVRRWSEMVIDEVSSFPRSRWKDLTDSVSAAIKKLRDLGVLQHPAEAEAERVERLVWHGQQHSVREEYGV